MAGRKLRGSVNPADSMFDKNGQDASAILGQNGFFNDEAARRTDETMRNQKRMAANSLEALDNFITSINKKVQTSSETTTNHLEDKLTVVYEQLHKTEDRILEVTETAKKKVKELEKVISKTTDKTLGKDLREQLKEVKEDAKDSVAQMKVNAKAFQQEIKQIETGYKQFSQAVDKNTDLILEKIGVARGSMMHNFAKDVSKHFIDNAGKISKAQMSRMAITALGVSSVSTAAMFQGQNRGMIGKNGMNTDQYNNFLTMMPKVSLVSRLATEEVAELGQSFSNAGIPLNATTKDLQGYLIAAGKAVRLTGLNSDMAASYTKNLMGQGYTSGQVMQSFKDLYGTMVGTNQTTKDLIESMGEASGLVANFGGTAHRNMFQFTNDIMVARGLFKTLGIDAKEAGSVIGSSFGNGGVTALQRAGLASSVLGGSSAARFNQMMADPASGAEMTMQAAMTHLMKIAPDAGLSSEQLNKKYGGNQEAIRGSYLRSMAGTSSMSQMYQVDESALQQGLSNYRGSGASTVADWMAQKKATMDSSKSSKAWDKAWDNFNSTMPELMEQLGRFGKNVLIILGSPIVQALIPLLKGANDVLDGMAEFMASDNPFIKSLTTLTSAALGLFGIVLPMVSAIRAVLPLLGVFGGGTAIAGITAGGLVPAIVGTAIVAGVGALMLSFGPQLIKAIGDGFTSAFNWLKGLNPFGIFGSPSGGAVGAGIPSKVGPSPVSSGVPAAGIPGIPGGSSNNKFGWLSAKYESGNPGTVSNYMLNGYHNVAYGAWQMDAGQKTPQAYMKWAEKNDPAVAGFLGPHVGGAMAGKGGEFGRRWAQMGKEHPNEFKQSQLDFMKTRYLDPLTSKFGSGLSNPYVQEAAFSTAVQHGPGSTITKRHPHAYGRGGEDILRHAGVGQITDANQLIQNIYSERKKAFPATAARYDREMNTLLQAMRQDANANHSETKAINLQQHHEMKVDARRRETSQDIAPFAFGNL